MAREAGYQIPAITINAINIQTIETHMTNLPQVASVAFVIEQSLMLSGWFSTMGLVWILAAVVYIALLYRFAKRRREQYGHEQGFPLSRGLGFILALILSSALIKGVVEYLYRSVFIGYSEYIDRYTSALIRFAEDGKLPASMEGVFAEMLKTIQEAPEPSILATVWASIWGNLIVGLVLGLILAGILARAPRPFGPQSEE